jgi:precorrin-3B synthase
MESGDGLIVRLKLTGGIVPLDLAVRIADWSRRFGNGEIDLTARSNLQIRGVTDISLPGLQDAIADAGLLDDNPDGEAIRNVFASPLAGLDADAVIDIRPLVAALEARLTGDPILYTLPAKFCFAVDDGGRFGLGGVRADVRFEAVAGPAFAVRLDGAPDDMLGPCPPEDLPDIAARLGEAFLARRGDARRMRDLVGRIGAAVVATDVGLRCERTQPLLRHSRESGNPWSIIATAEKWIPAFAGMTLERKWGWGAVLRIGLPFGRISAEHLKVLADNAGHNGAREIRLTPWRTIFVPLPSEDEARRVANDLPKGAFILDPADPRRRVAACVGAPACRSATTAIREDAARLAALVGEDAFLHVSGCSKGCAYPRAAPISLIGNNSLYDLVRDGRPSDSPVLRGLTLDEAAIYLRQMAVKQSQGVPA